MTRELAIQRTLLGETRLLRGQQKRTAKRNVRFGVIYEYRAFIAAYKKVLLPDGWAIARIVRANARRFFRTARHVNFIVLKSKQNRRVPIADTSERRHGIAGLFERLSEVTCPRARTVAHKTSPRVISDAEIIPDTTQRSNDR